MGRGFKRLRMSGLSASPLARNDTTPLRRTRPELASALGQGQVAVPRRIRAVRDNSQALLEVREFADDNAVFDLRHNCREQRLTPETAKS